MDIYIRGIRDRNRALNGDVVAVQLKPPEEWKILWEAIQDYEECQGRSLFESNAQNAVQNDASIVATEESPAQDHSWTSGWTAQESPRPSDSLEILGLDQLEQQFKEFTNKTKKPRNRNKKKRDVQKQDNQSQKSPAVDKDVSETVSNPSVGDYSTILESSSDVAKHVDVDINNCRDPLTNTQLVSDDNSNACIDLNTLSIQSSGEPSLVCKNNSFDNFVSSSEDEQFPKSTAVAPDELSGDEFSNSVSGESAASQQIVQDIEDAEFFAEHQDACNNNEPSEDFPVDIVAAEPVNPASEIENLVEQARQLSMTGTFSEDAKERCDTVRPVEIQKVQLGSRGFGKPVTSNENNEILLDCTDHATSANSASLLYLGKAEAEIGLETCPFAFKESVKMVSSCTLDSVGLYFSEENIELRTVITDKLSVENTKMIEGAVSLDNANDSQAELKTEIGLEATKIKMIDGGISLDNANDSQSEIQTEICSKAGEIEEGKLDVKPKRSRRNRGHKKRNKQKESKEVHPPNVESTPQKTDSVLERVQNVEQKSSVTPRAVVNETPQKRTPRRNNNQTNHVMARNITVADILTLPNSSKFLQKTGQVVYIIEKKHSRAAMGYIKKQQDNNPYWAMFSPTDHRLPRILIPMVDCPKGFWERPEDFKNSLFIAMIKEWDENSTFAKGHLARSLGEAGEIEPETDGILLENDIDCSEFDEECLKHLPPLPWTISQDELSRRRDFRDQCVFTIDPATARDLDDAVSVQQIEDGLLEVGVHIADVSFFLHEGTPLDYVASRRSTSVYLVQKVVPMLPRTLCEDLCSLNPGEDKLTFSVVWKINPVNCQIVEEWFGRTLIHSCTKFSYEHAQDMIDNGERDWRPDELPAFHGRFGARDVFWCVQQLHSLASKLRGRRFSDGALRLDQIKIQFNINNETGMASGFSIYEQKESHRLIEEFMLLANMAVAHHIYKAYPKKAFLRCHPPPQAKMMADLVEVSAAMGIHLDASTAGSLQSSLVRYAGEDVYSLARTLVLTHLCSKPMRPARYFCAGWTTTGKEDFHHYALNVPLYTHFTSPIRRYPDVLVHRLLAASLGLGAVPNLSELNLQKQAVHCNDKKNTAKRVHELSCELFLGAFIREAGPLEEQAVVVDVMDHSFDVLITRMGVIKRVYCDKLSVSAILFEKTMGIPKLTLTWSLDGRSQVQQVTIFTIVQVIINSIPKEPIKFNVVMKAPTSEPAESTS